MNKVELDGKLDSLATQFSYATGVKDAARIRSQCSLEEWAEVKKRAKEIYFLRKMGVGHNASGV